MNNRQKKNLLEKINRLTYTEHDEIFKLLKVQNVPFTQNKNGVFFNMSSIDNAILLEIEQFIEFCLKNKKELDEYDKKINECKISNKYDKILSSSDLISKEVRPHQDNSLTAVLAANKKEDWQAVMLEVKNSEKLTSFVEMLETNMDKIHKKKINTKFVNAKKRYSRKLVSDKKFDADLCNNLDEEPYYIASF